jgi:hypothetical protein
MVAHGSFRPVVGPSFLFGGSAGAGASFTRRGLRLEATGSVFALEQRRDVERGRSASVSEWGGGLSFRALALRDHVGIGGALSLWLATLRALGRDEYGVSGSAHLLSPRASLDAEIRVRVLPWLFVRVAPGVELSFFRERFSVAGTSLGDRGRARLSLPVGLLVELR